MEAIKRVLFSDKIRQIRSVLNVERAKKFFKSDTGKKVTGGFVIFASLGSFAAHIMPHFLLKYKYHDIIALYEDCEKKPLNKDLLALAQRTLNECNINAESKEAFSFFHVYGFDLWTIGSTALNCGADVGIPINFTYKKPEDVDKDRITFGKKPIDWETQAGEIFQNSFVLSEDAQKSAIAGQIYFNDNQRLSIRAAASAVIITSVYTSTVDLNKRLGLHQKPRFFRFILYMATSLLGIGVYFALADSLNLYYERKSDESVAAMGETYIKGAIEYYMKIIQRNVALFELMKEDGVRSMITPKGNDKGSILRNKRLPYIAKIDFYKQALKDMEAKKEKEATNIN